MALYPALQHGISKLQKKFVSNYEGFSATASRWPVHNYNAPSSSSRHMSSFITRLKQRKFPLPGVFAAVPVVSHQPPTTSANVKSAALHVGLLPEPLSSVPAPSPNITDGVADTINQINGINVVGEPTFASLGLGGWTPVGIAQTCFEYLHVTLGIPWWEAIVLGTLAVKLCMFPLVVKAQRDAAKMSNYLPELQRLQLKMTEARLSGDQKEVESCAYELGPFIREKQVNPLTGLLLPLAQAPVFISIIIALRQMANAPVESLREGGLWWFTDLTVPDQHFILPLITSATLFATIELGTGKANLSSQNLQTVKLVLRSLPLVILPFTVHFPGVILCYWVTSNTISLIQVGILRIPAVRDYFKIEPLVKHQDLVVKPKGFAEGFEESWTNLKIVAELNERKLLEDIRFQHNAAKDSTLKTAQLDGSKQVSKSVSEKS